LIYKNIQTRKPSNKLSHKKLDSYKIKKVKDYINYRLILPKNIKIHLIFHISLIKVILLKALKALYTEINLINPNIEYKIKNIFNYKYIKNQIKYLIKWKKYLYSENS